METCVVGKLSYASKLFVEFIRFAKEHKVYWLLPLVIVLGFVGILVVASHMVAPFIYTLF